MDDLVKRLRGKYSVGPDGVYEDRDFGSFTPPINAEAAARIETLEKVLVETIIAVKEFFEGEHFGINDVISAEELEIGKYWQRQDDNDFFDHIYVSQGGGGMSGDDFHGTAYFYIGDNSYMVVDY